MDHSRREYPTPYIASKIQRCQNLSANRRRTSGSKEPTTMTDKTQALHSVQSTVDNSNTAPHQHAATITASNSSTRPPQPRRSHDRQIPIIAPALPIVAHPHIQMHQIQLIAPLQHANHVFTASLVSSAIFRGRKKRSGKWTNEEEVYADMLIELFEKGLINEQNGCTLRSCLSRRLHCLPMRISKKYAGKGIGKAVYLSKNRVGSLDPSMLQRTMSRLRDAEMKFLKVVYPELNLVSAIIPCEELSGAQRIFLLISLISMKLT